MHVYIGMKLMNLCSRFLLGLRMLMTSAQKDSLHTLNEIYGVVEISKNNCNDEAASFIVNKVLAAGRSQESTLNTG